MYTYVRGRGWEPEPDCPRAERTYNNFKMVLEARQPEIGEYYWYWNIEKDGSLESLLNASGYMFNAGDIGRVGAICTHKTETPKCVVIVYHGPA